MAGIVLSNIPMQSNGQVSMAYIMSKAGPVIVCSVDYPILEFYEPGCLSLGLAALA